MPRIGDSPKLNLQAFEKLARSKDADNSQLRVSDDGSIKARSAFASRVVNFFRSTKAIEATNREVAEAFVASVQKSLDHQVQANAGGMSRQWSTDIVDTLRSQLADQLAGKASLSLRELKDRLTYLRDDIGAGKFVHEAEVKSQAMQALIDQFSVSNSEQPSLSELVERFQSGETLQPGEVNRVKQWHDQAVVVSNSIKSLVDGEEVDGLTARIENKVQRQRLLGETDSADAWQDTLNLLKDWRIYADEANNEHSTTLESAKHLVRYDGDFSKTVEGQKGHRWTGENPDHEPPGFDAQPKKLLLKRSAAVEINPSYQWLDKGGEELPSNEPVKEEDLESPRDRYAPSAEGRMVNAIIRDKTLPAGGHESTKVRVSDAAIDPLPKAARSEA